MNHRILSGFALAACLAMTVSASAAPLSIAEGDTVQKVLQGQTGKRVTVRTRAGEELTGTVRAVNAELVHPGEIAGKEFYDAVVQTKSIDTVIVRVKD
jgi:hypothetical protein